MVGPFIFVDEFGPARLPAGQGMDVRPHPHINLATVTYLFDGAIEHRDSIGSHAGDRAGRDQPDDRGRGIVHSERSPAEIRAAGPSLYGMQTWLALPDGQRGGRPGVRPCRRATGCRWSRTAAHGARADGRRCGAPTAATPCHSPTIYADIELAAGGSIPIEAEADERAVMLVGGAAELDGQRARAVRALRARARPRGAAVERDGGG